MKRIISILAALATVICANAQKPTDIYYTVEKDSHVYVCNANTGQSYMLEADNAKAFNIGIDNDHNVYVLVGSYLRGDLYHNFRVFKNGKLYQSFLDSGDQSFSSMAMKVVGNDVVVAGVETKKFNSRGYQARLVGYVNKVRVYQTDWERKSLKRDQFKGFCDIKGSGTKTKVVPATNFNSLFTDDVESRVYYVAAVDYVGGYIYTTGWGEREFTETPVGYQKQYLVRRCPRVWKNGKEIIQQYENRTGAAYSINVMRDGQNILTSGHQRDHICGWDGNKDMITDNDMRNYIKKEAVVYGGMVDGVPVFTRMLISSQNYLCYVNTRSQGNQSLMSVKSGNYTDVVAVGNDFYALSKSEKRVYKFSCSNWLRDDYDVTVICSLNDDIVYDSLLAVHK